jgi:hypothetical protein
MKNSTKRISGFLLMAFMLLGITPEVIASANNNTYSAIVKDNLVGGWEYTVEGAPEGYESGLIMIVKAGDTYKVQVQLAGGAMNGSDVVAKGNTITFKLMVEGESVSVSLSAKGSKISGTSTSSSGTYNITGVKSISPQ